MTTDLVTQAQQFQIQTRADLDRAVVLLHHLRQLRDTISSECDESTKTAHAAHKAAVALRKSHTDPIEAADAFLRKRAKDFIQSAGIDGGVTGIIVKMTPRYLVTDFELVPAEYKTLALDEEKVKDRVKKLRKQAAIPGIVVWEEPEIALSQEAPR